MVTRKRPGRARRSRRPIATPCQPTATTTTDAPARVNAQTPVGTPTSTKVAPASSRTMRRDWSRRPCSAGGALSSASQK